MMIDVLYPIYQEQNDPDFWERFRCSVDSLCRGTFNDFSICVSDTSPFPWEDRVAATIPVPFRYHHIHKVNQVRTGYGLFNKPFTVNVGVNTMVDAPILKMSDVDIVHPPNHLEAVYREISERRISFLTCRCHRLLVKTYTSDYRRLLDVQGEPSTAPGNPVLTTELFHKVRGLNERPAFAGLEDVDFLIRCMRAAGQGRGHRSWQKQVLVHLWHPKHWPAEQTAKDRELYLEVERRLKSGEMMPWDVNKEGYGCIEGELFAGHEPF